MEILFSAADYFALKNSLSEIDVAVPENLAERKNFHVETYSLVSLLASLPWSEDCFPVTVHRRERPDYYIKCGTFEIGLEHTEAVPQNLAKERALRAKGHGTDTHFLKPAAVDDSPKSSKEIVAEIEGNDPGYGWAGDSVERSWAEAISSFINKKVENAGKDGYDLFGDERLMIYDNWPAPALDHSRALVHLRYRLKSSSVWSTFRRVYIIDGSVVVELSAGNSIFHCLGRKTTI